MAASGGFAFYDFASSSLMLHLLHWGDAHHLTGLRKRIALLVKIFTLRKRRSEATVVHKTIHSWNLGWRVEFCLGWSWPYGCLLDWKAPTIAQRTTSHQVSLRR
jgi:hypothetical protein